MKGAFVYVLASARHATLYIGVTANLAFRVWQHRERRLKKWNRRWKIALIEAANPRWDDLYEMLNC